MCLRRSMRESLDLPHFFWKNPSFKEWTKYLQVQVKHASKLLLVYDFRSIMTVLNANPKVYSLGPAFIKEAIDKVDSIKGSYGQQPVPVVSQEPPKAVKFSSNTPQRKTRKLLDGEKGSSIGE